MTGKTTDPCCMFCFHSAKGQGLLESNGSKLIDESFGSEIYVDGGGMKIGLSSMYIRSRGPLYSALRPYQRYLWRVGGEGRSKEGRLPLSMWSATPSL